MTAFNKEKDVNKEISGKRFKISLKPLELFGWFLILISVCASMFVLGVFVGRGMLAVNFDSEKLEKQLISLREEVVEKQRKEIEKESKKLSDTPKLGFFEELKKSEENAEMQENFDLKPKKQDKASKQNKENKEVKKEPEGKFNVQVASVKDSKAADKIVAKLRQAGYLAYRTDGIKIKDSTWYRIKIGYFKDRDSAAQMLEKLRKDRIQGFISVD